MQEIYELAEYIFCGWRLAHGTAPLPTRDGVLDLAMEKHAAMLPERLSSPLSFGNTRVGFRCYELPEVLHAAQANLLAEGGDAWHASLRTTIDDATARTILRRRSVDVGRATAFAVGLARSLRESGEASPSSSPGLCQTVIDRAGTAAAASVAFR
jgi:hypothetical protein